MSDGKKLLSYIETKVSGYAFYDGFLTTLKVKK